VPLDRLISKEYAATLCNKIDPARASTPTMKVSVSSDTIAIMAGDRWGNMVSLIYSNFASFGSGVTVPGYGFVLQNRGSLFSLDPDHPNVVAPHKRPFHTLVPAFVMKEGKPVLAFGTPGGSGQPQSHLSALINMIDLGMNVQAASDAARFEHDQESNQLDIESNLYELVGRQLAAMGHTVRSVNGDGMGGLQLVQFTPAPGARAPEGNSIKGDPPVNGVYRAGSDMRKDGEAVGW
jgi:gamma-glutamyltranspeptidase/glutathione hydrolase